jgi:hypothetical protein
MGFTTTEAKHKYQEIMKTNTATQAEEKPEKPVNQAHTYEHIKSLVLESTTEKKIIKKSKSNNKNKNNAKPVIGIGI